MMLITPVTKSKQEKADSKNFDIFLLDSRGMQCSLNCKDTEIQWLIVLVSIHSLPYIRYWLQRTEKWLQSTATRTQLLLEKGMWSPKQSRFRFVEPIFRNLIVLGIIMFFNPLHVCA